MQASRFLDDIRVIDLSQYIPGPFATRQLADLGADVIKLEPPAGDPMRRFMPNDHSEISPIYRHVNRGKRICRLDLKSARGQEILAGLLAGADVLLESFRPGVLDRLGFDRDRLARINPGLVHCALSGYGQGGPYRLRAGHDINYCALSSMLATGGTREQPVIGYPPIADHAGALQASLAILAALHAQRRDGSGAYLDISLFESVLAWQYLPLASGAHDRAGAILNGGAACYNVYRCADGRYISLGAIETGFWENFCVALSRPQWVPRQFEPMPQAALIAEVGAGIGAQTQAHWQSLLDDVECCFEALLLPTELDAHPQVRARQALSASGPNYAGRINREALGIALDFDEIENPDDLGWREADA